MDSKIVQLCRTCLLETNIIEMEDIFNVANILKSIAPVIQLEQADGWPTKICSDCLIQANQAFKFQSLCIQSDLILRQKMIQKQKHEYCIVLDTDNSDLNDPQSPPAIEEMNIEDIKKENEISNKTKTCHYCKKEFDDSNDLCDHVQNHLKEMLCHICSKQLETAIQFKRHMHGHKQRGVFLCEKCGKRFSYIENLKCHERIHTGVKPFKCKLCDKSFAQSNDLKSHLITHSKDRSNLCNVCGKKFAREKYLRYHIKYKHTVPPDYKPFICVCGKSFSEQRHLSRHQNSVHTTERKYKCDWCNKGFKRNSTLRQHEKIHKGDKPFVCDVCKRRFLYKHVLHVHMATHTKLIK